MHHQRTRPVPDAEPFLLSSQVADLLHVSPKTVARWAKQGQLPYRRTLGGHRRYDPEQVDQLVRDLTYRP
jgi:excisionase family DNA binding protein